ncbi:MAG: KilA-N domain-containing protein [bacterium]
MTKNSKINVQGIEIALYSQNEMDFISLTDMLHAKDGDFFISDWLRNRNTIEFLGIWEKVHNPDFNYGEYAAIKSQAGLNRYKISVKEWVAKTKAIGIVAKTGRYGGTYAHKDIAFEFGMWISPEFKIFLIKEFQRLKELEQGQLGWNIRRTLTKINYRIHTDAIKEHLVPPELSKEQINLVHASEADILNMALFGKTAKQWRNENTEEKGNIRDFANVSQLVCLANLENLNAHFIKEGLGQAERLRKLNQIAIEQMKLLIEDKTMKLIEKKEQDKAK